MLIFQKILRSIHSQHLANADRNLFYRSGTPVLPWTPVTKQLFTAFAGEILALDAGQRGEIIACLTEKARQSFCSTNQFIDISAPHAANLEEVYRLLMADIIDALKDNRMDTEKLSGIHSARMRQWLGETDPLSAELNGTTRNKVSKVVCAEYAAALQMKVLHLDIGQLVEPVLDLGCGSHANMVRHLRKAGIAAFGVDRFIETPATYLKAADWLDFNLPRNYWGTIISNLSFSNHFLYHHQRGGDAGVRYAGKYMEILHSLKEGGSYHYAPALPMVERYLSPEKFILVQYPVDAHFNNSIVTRIL